MKKIIKLIKKSYVGIIPIIFVGAFLFLKPAIKNIVIDSNKYKTPANINFHDSNLYKCVVDAYNTQNNENIGYDISLTEEQLKTITKLECPSNEISDASGIETLVNLQELNLSGNQLTNIDLSKNTYLYILNLEENQLTNIDVSNNLNLGYLYLDKNQLTSIDVSKNTNLHYLDLRHNQLTNIDVSNNLNLRKLYLDKNQLTSIDVSNNTLLQGLYAQGNQLTNIDGLENKNEITDLWLTNNQLTSIDLSNKPKLLFLFLGKNQLTSIDLSDNLHIREVYIENNQLASITFSNNTYESLRALELSKNQLTEIGLQNLTNLEILEIEQNQLTTIDLKNLHSLGTLNLFKNQLTSVDLSECPSLTVLYLSANKLTSVDLSNNTMLVDLYIKNNQLTNIDLSKNTSLLTLNLEENQLTNIDLSKNTNLQMWDINQTKQYTIYKNDLSHISEQELKDAITNDNSQTSYTIKHTYIDPDGNEDEYDFVYNIERIEATSDKYIINDEKNYIYTYKDTDAETIKSNININKENIDETINNNKYILKYNNATIKEFDLKYSATSVTLNTEEINLNLEENNTYEFTPTLTPTNAYKDDLIWESSDTTVATVNNGVVTAVGVGNATITVKTADGNHTATCNVTVTNPIKYTATYKWNNGTEDKTKTEEFLPGENVIKGFAELIYVPNKKFAGWKYNGRTYDLSSTLPMPESDIELIAEFVDIISDNDKYKIETNGDNKYITGINPKTKTSDLNNLGLESDYKIKIFNKDGQTLKTSGNVGTGNIIKVYVNDQQEEETVVDTYTVVVKGDNNGDGYLDTSDIMNIYKYIKKTKTFDYPTKIASNINGDSSVDISDITKMYKIIKGTASL